MTPRRALPLALGALIGVALGLYYAWNLNPVEYVETAPSSLREPYREAYLTLIADAYNATGDLGRARARLSLFELQDPSEVLGALAQRRLATGGAEDEARALARLAADLAQPTPAETAPTSTPAAGAPGGAPSPSPQASRTPRPSPTPTIQATEGAPFVLSERELICDPQLAPPLLQVFVADAAGEPVPGVEVLVLWDEGQDRFYTGLQPEIGLGYGDFTLDPEISYTVQLEAAAAPVTSVRAELCQPESSDPYPGSVRLRFVQPER